MPTAVDDLRGYRLFFFSVDRGEAMPVHVAKGRVHAKPWLQALTLARSRHFRGHELNEIARLVAAQRSEIQRKWHAHSSRDD